MLCRKIRKCSEKDGDVTKGHRSQPGGALRLRGKKWADGEGGGPRNPLEGATDHD